GSRVLAMCYKSRKGTTALGGALAPSMDQAGRRFPIAAASEFVLDAELTQHPEALPLVLESVWVVTSQLVIDLQAVGRAELEATPLRAEVDTDLPAALAAYRGWTRDLELDDFIELVF